MPLPAGLLPWIERVFLNASGTAPNAHGSVAFYVAGTSTPQDTFSSSDLDPGSVNPNPLLLGADGRPNAGADVFLLPSAYKCVVKDSEGAIIYTYDGVTSSPADVFYAALGQNLALGSKSVTSGYDVTNADSLITVNEVSVDPAIINLQPSAERGAILFVQNISSATRVALTPSNPETINGISGAYTMPVAASPSFPAAMLLPTVSGGYYLFRMDS